MNFKKFVKENCMLCGTQRCNPYDPEWLEGCQLYKEIKEKEKMSKRGKYTFYTDGANKIIAVSSYAGRTVRGVAKCDPRDTFDSETGEALAVARCASKIADKRYARACKEQRKAELALIAAQKRLDKMNAYKADAATEKFNANAKATALAQEF